MSPSTPWGERSANLYDQRYAKHYRACDDRLVESGPTRELADWLREICGRFDEPIDVLDLGCGTGRYFFALSNVRHLTGLDASEAMLAEARHPSHQDRIRAESIELIRGDLLTADFARARFDLVYSIGVLAEHTPFSQRVVERVGRWLRPGGRFAFTTVHPESATVRQTVSRRAASALLPFAPGALGRALHARLMAGGMYADERWLTARLASAFEIETLERFRSEVHLHARGVARKIAEGPSA